jgi:TRAP-type transport system small permease protein
MWEGPRAVAIVNAMRRFNRASATVAGFAILLMIFAGAADVFATNLNLIGLSSRPIPSTNEFMATMMVAAVFLGLSQAQQRRAHIQLDADQIFGPRIGHALQSIHHVGHGILYGLIAVFGWATAAHAVRTGEFAAGLFDFPVWPARIALALGATTMTVQCLIDLVGVFDSRFRTASDPSDAPATH